MKKCAFCHIEIECTSNNACWCYSLPHIPIEINKDNCLCKSCLIQEMAKCINHKKMDLTNSQKSQIASLGIDQPLTEKVDYYYNANGLMVFTKWYHLKRGSCCKNQCKHCAY